MSKTFERVSDTPLHWPTGYQKTKRRQRSRFNTTLFNALENVNEELARLASDSGKRLEQIIISSNYSLSNRNPDDPGVAVWFVWDGEQFCIPVDRYDKIEDNLQAIFHCIKADRTKLRHGGLNLVKASYRGFKALSHDLDPEDDWREVLSVVAGDSFEDVRRKFHKLRKTHHPDHGGDANQFNRVMAAFDAAEQFFLEGETA